MDVPYILVKENIRREPHEVEFIDDTIIEAL